MNSEQEEEIESLKAIFCKKDEIWTKKDAEGQIIIVNFDFSSATGSNLKRQDLDEYSDGITCFLETDYPGVQLPRISVRCSQLPACAVQTIKDQLEERAATLRGQPMLLDLCCLAQELLAAEIENIQKSVHKACSSSIALQGDKIGVTVQNYKQYDISTKSCQKNVDSLSELHAELHTSHSSTGKSTPVKSKSFSAKVEHRDKEVVQYKSGETCEKCDSGAQVVTALLHLDHMRSRQSYVKLIKRWTVELGLSGRLLFYRKLILILLQGDEQAVREYIVRNRTTNVDVDSKGRQCKERMLTVLCELPAQSHVRLSEFCVQEPQTAESVQELFQSLRMEGLYQDYVCPFIHTSLTRK